MESTGMDFWRRVDVSGGKRACWPWTGSVSTGSLGYGTLKYRNEYTYAHRVAWELTYGEPLGDRRIRHRCDNPLCCNPLHMMLGSHQDNMDDMVARGRQKGHDGPPLHSEYNAMSKLSRIVHKLESTNEGIDKQP
jgi:hypothetical protein